MNRSNRSILVILLIASALFAADDGYRAQVERFRRSRDEFLRSPRGPLLQAGRYRVNEGTSTLGSDPASTMVLPANAPRHVGSVVRHGNQFVFQPSAEIQANLNNQPITEPVTVLTNGAPSPPDRIGFGAFKFRIHQLNNEFYLFLSDSKSPFLRAFAGTTWFPINPAYRVDAQFVPTARQRAVLVPFTDGSQTAYTVMGDLVFQLGGQNLRLKVLVSPDDKKPFILFQDQTSGKETYGDGRMLDVDSPVNGKVTLDFNEAFNTFCAYDPYAVCPISLEENRLAILIRAGETYHRLVVFAR